MSIVLRYDRDGTRLFRAFFTSIRFPYVGSIALCGLEDSLMGQKRKIHIKSPGSVE